MKKILAILAALTIGVSAGASIVACGYRQGSQKPTVQQDISTLKLRIDLDSLEATYENIATEVNKQIATLSEFAKLDVDYTIDQTAFKEENQLKNPQLVNVSAMKDSKFLYGNFNIVIVKNLTNIFESWTRQGDYDESVEQLANLKKKIKELVPSVQEDIDYTITIKENGSWTAKTTKYESLIDIDFTFNQTMVDLKEISFDSVEINDDVKQINTQIIEKISQLSPKAKVGTDFEIIGNTDNAENLIEVKSLPKSNYLVGYKTITIEKFNLEAVGITNLDVLANDAEISKNIIDKIYELKKLEVKPNTDFEIIKLSANEVQINALETSKVLKKKTNIELSKIDISSLSKVAFTNLKISSDLEEVTAAVNKAITNLLVRKNETEPRIEISTNDFLVNKGSIPGRWEVSANVDSKKLAGNFAINLEKFDISTGVNVLPTFVGDKYQNLITNVIGQINQKLSTIEVKEGVDYQIIDKTNQLKEAGTIVLETLENSKLITGQLTINVNPKSISEIVLYENLTDLNQVGDLNKTIINKINSLFTTESGITISQADYKIYDASNNEIDWMQNPAKGTFEVKGTDSSKIITGAFKFNIGPIKVSEIKVETVQLGDDYSNLIDNLLNNITSLVKNLKIVEGVDYKITDSTDSLTKKGTIIFEALSTSSSLIGNKTIEVSSKSIKDLTLETIGLGKREKINDMIIAKIQTLFNAEKIKVKSDDFVIYNVDQDYEVKEIFEEGQYRIQASSTSKIIDGEFIFKVINNEINGLGSKFDNAYDTSISAQQIENEIGIAINDFIHSNLENNIDYEILDENGQLKNLDEAGLVIVKAKDTGHIEGQFSFEIKKYDLSEIKILNPELINVTTSDPTHFKEIIKLEIDRKFPFKEVIENVDYQISPMENWFINGEIIVKALDNSKLLANNLVVKINLVDLSEIKIEQNFKIGDKVDDIKTLVKDEIEKRFLNSWIEKPELGIDYEILGINNESNLTTVGSKAIKVRAIYNSKKLTREFTIGVNEFDLGPNLAKLYDISGTNYLLTSNISIWGPDALEWQNPTRQSWKWILEGTGTRENPSMNPIKPNEILQTTNYFLATTRGIYSASHLIEGTQNLEWTAEDIILMENNLVITTHGSWYISETNITDWHDYEFIRPVKIPGLDDLNSNEFIANSNSMIITTRGVWTKTVVNNKGTYSKVNASETLNELTKDDLLSVNDKFLITKKGIWWQKPGSGGNLQLIKTAPVEASDILEINDNYVIIKNFGAVTNDGLLIDIAEGHEKILAKNKNYLVTSEFIYFQGREAGTFVSGSEILAISESFLVTTKGAYYQGVKITRTGFNTFTADEILGVNRNFLITTKGVQFRNLTGLAGTVDIAFNQIKKAELLGYTDNFIVVAGKRPVFVNDSGQKFFLGLGTLNATNFIALNEHYVISKAIGIWYVSGPTQNVLPRLIPYYGLVTLSEHIIALKGKMLVTTNGMWKGGNQTQGAMRYELSVGFKPEEIIAVNEDRVITTRGIFYGIGGKLNPYV